MLHVSIDGPSPSSEVAPGVHPTGLAPELASQPPGLANVVARDFLKKEIQRVGAPPAELRTAFALVTNATAHDPRAYDALTPRMRRLVDLAIVAGGCLGAADFEPLDAENGIVLIDGSVRDGGDR